MITAILQLSNVHSFCNQAVVLTFHILCVTIVYGFVLSLTVVNLEKHKAQLHLRYTTLL